MARMMLFKRSKKQERLPAYFHFRYIFSYQPVRGRSGRGLPLFNKQSRLAFKGSQ